MPWVPPVLDTWVPHSPGHLSSPWSGHLCPLVPRIPPVLDIWVPRSLGHLGPLMPWVPPSPGHLGTPFSRTPGSPCATGPPHPGHLGPPCFRVPPASDTKVPHSPGCLPPPPNPRRISPCTHLCKASSAHCAHGRGGRCAVHAHVQCRREKIAALALARALYEHRTPLVDPGTGFACPSHEPAHLLHKPCVLLAQASYKFCTSVAGRLHKSLCPLHGPCTSIAQASQTPHTGIARSLHKPVHLSHGH